MPQSLTQSRKNAMFKGKSFLDEPIPIKNVRHLRIVISDPNENNEFLTVSVDTLRSEYQDKSCVIEPGEHKFIRHKSFVNYKYARVISFAKIVNGEKAGLFIRKENVSAELLLRIQNGAKISRNLRNEFRSWFSLF